MARNLKQNIVRLFVALAIIFAIWLIYSIFRKYSFKEGAGKTSAPNFETIDVEEMIMIEDENGYMYTVDNEDGHIYDEESVDTGYIYHFEVDEEKDAATKISPHFYGVEIPEGEDTFTDESGIEYTVDTDGIIHDSSERDTGYIRNDDGTISPDFSGDEYIADENNIIEDENGNEYEIGDDGYIYTEDGIKTHYKYHEDEQIVSPNFNGATLIDKLKITDAKGNEYLVDENMHILYGDNDEDTGYMLDYDEDTDKYNVKKEDDEEKETEGKGSGAYSGTGKGSGANRGTGKGSGANRGTGKGSGAYSGTGKGSGANRGTGKGSGEENDDATGGTNPNIHHPSKLYFFKYSHGKSDGKMSHGKTSHKK
jgi:hypothetical protein